jgi:hypothetical protein
MGYYVDERRAIADTLEAWRLGIGWHASTDRFVQLPYWFAGYMATALNPRVYSRP